MKDEFLKGQTEFILNFNEADNDNTAAGNNAAAAATSADDDTNNNNQNNNTDDNTNADADTTNTDNNNTDNNNNNNQDNNNQNNDDNAFDIDASFDDNGGDNNTGDAGNAGGNAGGGTGNAPEEQVDVDNAAKKKDREIFDNLTPQQQKIKNIKLKELYMDLYDKCESLIDKYNQVGTDNEKLAKPIKRILNCLYDLKTMTSDYLLNIFDSSSYIENDITFNGYLSQLNAIRLIAQRVTKEADHEDDNDGKEEK